MNKKILKSADLKEDLKPIRRLPPSIARTGVITKGDIEAKEKGAKVIAQAERDGERIREEALGLRSQIEGEMEKAREKGFQKGREEGLEELSGLLLKARELREQILASAESELIRLVLSISEKVLGKIVETHKEAILAIIREGLKHSLGEHIVVRLHPADWKRLKGEDLQFKDIVDRTKRFQFREDETIQKGGCIIESEIGTIDAQLETQLKAIRKALGV